MPGAPSATGNFLLGKEVLYLSQKHKLEFETQDIILLSSVVAK